MTGKTKYDLDRGNHVVYSLHYHIIIVIMTLFNAPADIKDPAPITFTVIDKDISDQTFFTYRSGVMRGTGRPLPLGRG